MRDILFIDDDKQSLLLAKLFLEREGFKVHACTNTARAREILKKHHISLIITDVGIPDENGFEFYDWLQTVEEYKSVPVLFISGHAVGFDEHLTKHREQFIPKPIFYPDLLDRLHKMLDDAG